MTESHRQLFHSVDEKKALEQLEKFQREIQSARWKREQASAEFETFVKELSGESKTDAASSTATAERPRPTPSVVRAIQRHSLIEPPARRPESPQPEPRPPQQRPPEPPPAAPPPAARTRPEAAPVPVPEPDIIANAAQTESYSMRLQRWRGLALVGAALIAIVLLAIGWWKNIPTETPAAIGTATAPPASAPQPAATPKTAAPATIPPPAAATPPVAQPAATLNATRRVWVRVMADGHRLFERELAPGDSVPLDATQAIVIRAGDAGAVRITFADGRAETLGGEGQVVTKRYEIKK